MVSRVGEPPVWTVLPSTIAAPSVWYVPAALATPGTPWICASIVVFSVWGVVPVLSIAVNAVFGATWTAVPLNDVLKMLAKPLSIWSVSTYVPVIIATPSRIARSGEDGPEWPAGQAAEGEAGHRVTSRFLMVS